MNNSRKPKFTDGSGGIINQDRLSNEKIEELKLLLPNSMSIAEKTIFLKSTSEATSIWEMTESEESMAGREIAERIVELENAARRLQRAIWALQGAPYGEMYPHFDHLIWGSNPPIKLPEQLRQRKVELGSILEEMWDELQILGEVGKYAKSHLKIERTTKPTTQKARSLVFWIVNQHLKQFGCFPPSYKGAWFPDFMEALANILEIKTKFGHSMISTVIKEMKKTNPAN